MSKINLESLIGQRFNAFTVISQAKRNDRWQICFNCLCDCGSKKKVSLYHLQKGLVKSCGCVKKKWTIKIEDCIGQKFGRLTILGVGPKAKKSQSQVLTICDCGVEKTILWSSVKRGTTKSCGCLGREWKDGYGARTSARVAGVFTVPPGQTGLKTVYWKYKDDARKRSTKDRELVFDITLEDFHRLTQMNCYYSGHPPGNIRKDIPRSQHTKECRERATYVYNGLDRVDNNKGYTLDNVVPCCKICNIAKHAMTKEEFLDWVRSVAIHLKLIP